MVETAELTQDRTLTLPPDIAALFRPLDRFVVWVEGDTLHLKRMTPAPVTDIVAAAAPDQPLSLNEINDIVHKVRRQRHA